MGALVQVLAGDSVTVATAFTDLHGRYLIANLHPGRYLVRASATLFVPASRANLHLATGTSTIVNLTMAALFDNAAWLPAQRRRADEPDDDWKWTLRSGAGRPILRIIEDGNTIEVSSSATQETKTPTKARATVASGDGEFGGGGIHNILALHRGMDAGGDMMMRADIGTTRVPSSYGPSAEFDAGYERRAGFGGLYGAAQRTVVSYRAHPEMMAAGVTTGLTVMEFTSAQRMALGDQIEVEAGGSLQAVHTAGYAFGSKPFVRIAAHPGGSWTLQYRMATDQNLQGFDDVTSARSAVPVAITLSNGKLGVQKSRHQEAAIGRKAGKASIAVVYFHDRLDRTVLSGGGASGPGETKPGVEPFGMLVDPTTGSFRSFGAGYHANGARASFDAPLTGAIMVAAEFSTGAALGATTGADASFHDTIAGLQKRTSQAATVALKGRVLATGTRLRASYRWQQASLVSAIDPFSAYADQAYLSCMIRQPIRLGSHLPQGLEATIDVTNLLAEGYRPFLSEDGKTLYFAQAPRTISAGLSFNF